MDRPRALRRLLAAGAACVLVAAAAGAATAPGPPAALSEAFRLYYKDKNYAAARAAVAAPAELGEPRAQYLLGVMLLRGQGGEADAAGGLGWLRAAAENGDDDARGLEDKVRTEVAGLPPAGRDRALDVLMRYGATGIAQRVVPQNAEFRGCPGLHVVEQRQQVSPEYPPMARRAQQDAAVSLRFTVGIDGIAREPEVLAAYPADESFVADAIEALLLSRYYPAERGGLPVESTARSRVHFRMTSGGRLWDEAAIRRVKATLEAGNPYAEFEIASAAWADADEFKIPPQQSLELMLHAAQAGHPRAQYWLAQLLTTSPACGRSAKAALWLDAAARAGEPAAAVQRARQLLDGSPSDDDQGRARALLASAARSDSLFAARQAIALLAATPFDAVRDPALALATAKKLRTDAYDADPLTWEALAAARAANGDFKEAARLEARALKLAERYRWNTERLRERLDRYGAGAEWRGDPLALPPHPGLAPLVAGLSACRESVAGTRCVLRDVASGVLPLDPSR